MNSIRFYLRASRSTEFGLLKQRQKSKVFEDNISTDLMSKMPVSQAEDTLKRATGISGWKIRLHVRIRRMLQQHITK